MKQTEKTPSLMKHVPIIGSSNVFNVAYEAPSKTLQVRFKDQHGKPTSLYNYANVTAKQFAELLTSHSKGKYLDQNIKNNPAHACTRIE